MASPLRVFLLHGPPNLRSRSARYCVLVLGLPPESDCCFKHVLIQDTAYETLLTSRRQTLHRRVGETLRDRFADTAAAEPEVLAHHFTQAGLTDCLFDRSAPGSAGATPPATPDLGRPLPREFRGPPGAAQPRCRTSI
jgi:hypothetical protein